MLNFGLQGEQAFAKFIGLKYACALSIGCSAISLVWEAMQHVLSPTGSCSEICMHSNSFTFKAVERLLSWGVLDRYQEKGGALNFGCRASKPLRCLLA